MRFLVSGSLWALVLAWASMAQTAQQPDRMDTRPKAGGTLLFCRAAEATHYCLIGPLDANAAEVSVDRVGDAALAEVATPGRYVWIAVTPTGTVTRFVTAGPVKPAIRLSADKTEVRPPEAIRVQWSVTPEISQCTLEYGPEGQLRTEPVKPADTRSVVVTELPYLVRLTAKLGTETASEDLRLGERPSPTAELWVVIVEDASKRASLGPEQVAILLGQQVREATRHADGTYGFLLADVAAIDSVRSDVPAELREGLAKIKRAMQDRGLKAPVWGIAGRKGAVIAPLPKTVAEALEALSELR